MVKSETVFSDKVAGYVKNSALILFIDTGVLFAGGIVFAALQLASLLLPVVFIAAVVGFALAVAAAVLARYITKAAVLQEDSEGTI